MSKERRDWRKNRKEDSGVYRKNSQMEGLTFRSLMSWVSDRERKGCPGRKGWKKYVLRFWRRGGNWRSYARARERDDERQVRKLFITPSFRANSRMLRRLGAETRHPARLSCVIFHGAVDDNAIRGSSRRCRKEFSLREEIPSWRASEFCNNKRRDEI